uniref:Uncharacterized protein n=1 Tax=Panagrolaimus sp. JU765 TaxID=591449 RepID=A0AC34REG1_9BILA
MKLVFLTPFLFAITYAELAHRGEPEVYDRRITTTGDWMITVPFYGFVIDICINKPAERNDETMLFCIGGKPEKANDVGCPEDFCGVRAYGKDHPSLSGTVTGVNTMTRCIWLYVQPREMIINEYKNIEKCHWARQDDGKLRFQIRTFPPGFVVTLIRSGVYVGKRGLGEIYGLY